MDKCDPEVTSRGKMLVHLALDEAINNRDKKLKHDGKIRDETGKNDSCIDGPSPLNRVINDEASCSRDDVNSVPDSVAFMEDEILNNDLWLSESEIDDTDEDKDYVLEEGISDSDSGEEVQVSKTDSRRKVVNKTAIEKEGRKRERKPQLWLCNKRKESHAAGQEYTNKSGKKRPAREIKPPCTCKSKCFEKIPENIRLNIFSQYWKKEKDSNIKRQFVSSCVEVKEVCRPRERDGSSSKKNHSLIYSFLVNNEKIRVCKVMFLNTLCISNKVVINAIKKRQEGGIVEPDLRGKQIPTNKTEQIVIDSAYNHIAMFPSYQSHYSRERSGRKFLDPTLTITDMYNSYVQFCSEKNVDPKNIAKKWLYTEIFNKKFNLSFKPTANDTCDICDSFIAKLKCDMTQQEKEKVKSDYDDHLREANQRYNLKSFDAASSKENPNHKMITADLQKCLATPLLSCCESFYKRKLWTFNFTLYDSSDGSAHCVMWDETKAGRGGNEVASAILKWADNVIPNSQIDEITLWTDNCWGQNKNMCIIICLFWILHKYDQIKVINHKFLLKGHTHMEADTVHALIERKRKKLPPLSILSPRDWQQMIRQTSKKFTVYNMELPDFKDFKSLYNLPHTSPFVHRKLDVNKEPLLLSQCIQLKVKQDNIGVLLFKTCFEDDFREIDLIRFRRQHLTLPQTLVLISNEFRPISTAKYKDLLDLLKFLPSECHAFYKSLSHTNNSEDFPVNDEQ